MRELDDPQDAFALAYEQEQARQSLGRGVAPAGVSGGYRPAERPPREPTRHLALEPYGIQSQRVWTAAEQGEKPVIDAMRSEYLWRASVAGENVELILVYGTQAGITIDGLRLPFEAFIPGQVGLRARKLDPDAPASIRITLTAATGGVPTVRAFQGVGAIPSTARTYTALAASTLTVAGVVGIAVAAGASLPLIAPAAVTVGSGIVELTL